MSILRQKNIGYFSAVDASSRLMEYSRFKTNVQLHTQQHCTRTHQLLELHTDFFPFQAFFRIFLLSVFSISHFHDFVRNPITTLEVTKKHKSFPFGNLSEIGSILLPSIMTKCVGLFNCHCTMVQNSMISQPSNHLLSHELGASEGFE